MSVARDIALALVLPIFAGPAGAGDDDALPYYVGRSVCLECHVPAGTAVPCTLEPITAHDGASDSLTQPEALHIAEFSGVAEPPAESRLCLGCHGTAADVGVRWTMPSFDFADGVQCEACHDAGSLHVRATRDRSLARPAPMRTGDRTECAACHQPRPSHEVVLERGARRPDVDSRYHTPVNLALGPDGAHLYVVAESSDRLIVVDTDTGAVIDAVDVGRRPHDVAVSPDGRRLYVTNRLAGTLSVIDARERALVAEIPVGSEPHGVLADPAGRLVFVLNTGQDSMSVIDTRSLTEIDQRPAGRGPWSIALRADGRLVVTDTFPRAVAFREPSYSEIFTFDAAAPVRPRDRIVVAAANMLQGVAVVPGRDVALVTLMRCKNLVPITRLAQGWTITNGLGVLWPDGRVDQVLLDEPGRSFPDPMDVAVSPDGRIALVTGGGTDEVAVVDVPRLLETIERAAEPERTDVLPNHLGKSRDFVRARIAVGRNPRGVVFAPDGRLAYVANALDDSVSVIDTSSHAVVRTIDLGGPHETSETRRGERLFHSAGITAGQQFSCRSCHPDGHINGLSFDIEPDGLGMSPVDNRTLRGIVDTAPFKWEGTNPTLARQCGPRLAVFFTRLQPYDPSELAALVRYISTIERPPNRHRRADGLTPAQRRGKIVFERTVTNFEQPIPPERRCVTCHRGTHGTSLEKLAVGTTMWFDQPVEPGSVELADVSADIEHNGELGLYFFMDTGVPARAFDVPHLNNIYDSPPYLHNGCAATLEEIWTKFDVLGQHGVTSDLTRQQFNDLIDYLKTQ